MVLEFPERPLDTFDLIESKETKHKIPRDNPIQRATGPFEFVYTVGANAPVYRDDDFLNLIEKLLWQTESDFKFSKAGVSSFYLEKDDMGTAPYKDSAKTTQGQHTCRIFLCWKFQSDPTDRLDATALLAANKFSSQSLNVKLGSMDDVASANPPTLDSAILKVELREVTGTLTVDGNEVNILDTPFADIREDEKLLDILSNKNSFDTATFKEDVTPAPANILKQVMIQTDNRVRTNDLISDIKIQREKGTKKTLLHKRWLSAFFDRKTERALETVNTGVLIWDFVEQFGAGLVLRGNEGDVRYRMLTGATVPSEDSLRILSRYISLGGN